ncbi:proteoglycan 4-like [Girardinichthys multiradiatus]|uniref:proteoglycan 4-like n=1 Tax=Girardinichthys multiradiatus TaxID=208333 RepID=UPI001FAE745B|nr:proteoglycan 4-like [Girardinichthys multiradiatus]
MKTHPEAHKRKESPQSQNPSGSQDQSTPRTTPASPLTQTMQTPPNHLPQIEKGPTSVTGTKTRNQKPSRNHPGLSDAHTHPRSTTYPHPRMKPTPTPTFEQIPEHIRRWTPRLTPSHPLPQTLRPASRMCSLKERVPAMRWDLPANFGGPYARRCTKGPRARARRPGMHYPKTPATYLPGPKAPKAQPGPQPGSRYTPGTPSPQARPRPTQAQAPREHLMQPPDVSPESHQSPTPAGTTAPSARPPRDPSPGTPQTPQPRHPPESATTPHRTKPKAPHPY